MNRTSKEIYTAFRNDLKGITGRHAEVTAHSGIVLSKESSIPECMYAIKATTSITPIKTGANRAENEIQSAEIMVFVKTNDSLQDKDDKYFLMLDMGDQLRDWIYRVDVTDYTDAIHWVSYEGISRTIDDQKGFYAQIHKIKFETDLSLYGIGDMEVEDSFTIS